MYKADEIAMRDFHAGNNYKSYNYFGAHRYDSSICFRVWAPNADRVYLVGDFNSWSEVDEMTRIYTNGIFECFIDAERMFDGCLYKYKIIHESKELYKADPYSRMMQKPPDTASIYIDESFFEWTDQKYLIDREKKTQEGFYNTPINIYEVHLGSFMRKADGSYISYREAANLLASYSKKMGYTHIELMPISEHPSDSSWGYQICGYYAPTSRFGNPDDFKYFIDTLHSVDIGVILDWVPAHFPKDEHGLFEFDGKPLYEYSDLKRQENKTWGTRYFDIGKNEVTSFLISNAFYFAELFHIDGLRVDAVSSMLYLDYDREFGEWTPNRYGGNINFEAVAFFKKLNKAMKTHFPDVLMIAEESSAYKNITTFTDGGLGFDLKWNMGWMNDSLSYISTNHENRSEAHTKLTFPLLYAFSEKHILPISHDEVVYGKKSLLDKMPGNYSEKFSGTRAYLTYMITQSGKKLSFMSCEYGQFAEWNHSKSIEWFLLEYPSHRKLHNFTSDLNHFYLQNKELWECDGGWDGFEWVLCDSSQSSVIAYNRYDKDKNALLIIVNFSSSNYCQYALEVSQGSYKVVFSSDDLKYGGNGIVKNNDCVVQLQSNDKTKIIFDLPANTALILKKENIIDNK